jgi:hypothetical protein
MVSRLFICLLIDQMTCPRAVTPIFKDVSVRGDVMRP